MNISLNKNIKTKRNKAKMLLNRILNFALAFSLMTSIAYATDTNVEATTDTVGGVVGDMNSGNGIYGTISQIMGVLAWLGFAIALFKIMQIGIMLMLGAGKSKSDAKTALIPWLIGAFVCVTFGTVGPWIISLIIGSGSGGVFDI